MARLHMTRAVGEPNRWIATQSRVHLKGMLWTAFESEPVCIILGGINGASARAYRFVQRVYHTPGVNMTAAARDIPAMGMRRRLSWDPRRTIHMPAPSSSL